MIKKKLGYTYTPWSRNWHQSSKQSVLYGNHWHPDFCNPESYLIELHLQKKHTCSITLMIEKPTACHSFPSPHNSPVRYMPIQSPASTSSLMSQQTRMSWGWPMQYSEVLTVRVERLWDDTRSGSLEERGRVKWSAGLMGGHGTVVRLKRAPSLPRRRRDGEDIRILLW